MWLHMITDKTLFTFWKTHDSKPGKPANRHCQFLKYPLKGSNLELAFNSLGWSLTSCNIILRIYMKKSHLRTQPQDFLSSKVWRTCHKFKTVCELSLAYSSTLFPLGEFRKCMPNKTWNRLPKWSKTAHNRCTSHLQTQLKGKYVSEHIILISIC